MMVYTEEMRDFFKSYVKGHHYNEIQQAFNERFPDTPITINQVRSYVKNHKLNTGFTGHFKKGAVSHNKGKKQSDYMSADGIEKSKATRFKKGQSPVNHRPVGSTRVTKDGYIEVKVAEPDKWELNSRVVWESVNGKIPKGYVILHINGITTDDGIENLQIMSRAEVVRLNQQKLFGDNVEINKSAIAIAKLTNGISEAKKRKRKQSRH